MEHSGSRGTVDHYDFILKKSNVIYHFHRFLSSCYDVLQWNHQASFRHTCLNYFLMTTLHNLPKVTFTSENTSSEYFRVIIINKPMNYAERISIKEEVHVCWLDNCLYWRAWELFSLHNPLGHSGLGYSVSMIIIEKCDPLYPVPCWGYLPNFFPLQTEPK